MNLLIIEHDDSGADALAERLQAAGFRPQLMQSAREALRSGIGDSAAAVLLLLGHGAPLATSVIGPLRRGGLQQPLLVLSARDDWRERVASIEAGADDFVVKPIHSEELTARLRAVIRRTLGACTDRIVAGDIEIDLKGQCGWREGQCLDLTRNEFRVLRLFVRAADGQVAKGEIARAVWPDRPDPSPNAIEVLIGRLRAKLGAGRIQAVRGLGYRLTSAASDCDEPEPFEVCRRDTTILA